MYYDLDRDFVQVHYTLWLKYEPDWVKWKENKPQTNDVGTD